MAKQIMIGSRGVTRSASMASFDSLRPTPCCSRRDMRGSTTRRKNRCKCALAASGVWVLGRGTCCCGVLSRNADILRLPRRQPCAWVLLRLSHRVRELHGGRLQRVGHRHQRLRITKRRGSPSASSALGRDSSRRSIPSTSRQGLCRRMSPIPNHSFQAHTRWEPRSTA